MPRSRSIWSRFRAGVDREEPPSPGCRAATAAFGELVDADHYLLAGFRSPAAARVLRFDQAPLHVADSTAATAPPIASMRASSAQRLGFSSSTLAVDHMAAVEQVARIPGVGLVSDDLLQPQAHCWSHGRGRPSASFQAGSWTARARASFDSTTASISIRMR